MHLVTWQQAVYIHAHLTRFMCCVKEATRLITWHMHRLGHTVERKWFVLQNSVLIHTAMSGCQMSLGAIWQRRARWKGQAATHSLIYWPHGLEKDSGYRLVISFTECNILACGVYFCISGAVSVFPHHLIHQLDSLCKCNCFHLAVVAKLLNFSKKKINLKQRVHESSAYVSIPLFLYHYFGSFSCKKFKCHITLNTTSLNYLQLSKE